MTQDVFLVRERVERSAIHKGLVRNLLRLLLLFLHRLRYVVELAVEQIVHLRRRWLQIQKLVDVVERAGVHLMLHAREKLLLV